MLYLFSSTSHPVLSYVGTCLHRNHAFEMVDFTHGQFDAPLLLDVAMHYLLVVGRYTVRAGEKQLRVELLVDHTQCTFAPRLLKLQCGSHGLWSVGSGRRGVAVNFRVVFIEIRWCMCEVD